MSAARTLALEYLKMAKLYGPQMAFGNTTIDDAITALEAELAQPVEPVAWRKNHKGVVDVRHTYTDNPGDVEKWAELGVMLEPLYAAPPPAVPKGWQLVTICMLKQVTEALAARLGTDADEWPLVLSSRNIIEDLT